MTQFEYYSHNKMSEVKKDFTPALINELKSFMVERYVDNMSTKDLVAYVMDDLDRYYEKMSDAEFIDEAQNYWEDHFDDVVEEVEEYANCDFKKPIEDRRDDFLDSLSEGKDLSDEYGSMVDTLVDSMGVTDDKVSITHRRKDLDLL